MHCYKCKSKPPLIKVEANPKEDKFTKLCFGCGFSFEDIALNYYCSLCNNYFLCGRCKICSNGHYMKKTIYLENTNVGYLNNFYYCNICKQKNKTDDDGIWHCNLCKYDICLKCSN